MKFYRQLYCSDTLKKRQRRIIWKIKHNAGQASIYVVALSPKEGEQLEIFHAGQLLQKYYKYAPPSIIGIADGYQEAVELTVRIAQEVYDRTGGLEIKKYLKERDKGI